MCEKQEKDYSLLRPVDPKTTKAGDMLCSIRGNFEREFIAGPDHSGCVCVAIKGNYDLVRSSDLRMAPLCWVEGRPVYKGDVLYHPNDQPPIAHIVAGYDAEQDHLFFDGWSRAAVSEPEHMMWTPPKVKRKGWVNIYHCIDSDGLSAKTSHAYNNVEAADAVAGIGRIACVQIEWEE